MAGITNNMANLASAKITADLTASATSVTVDDATPFASLGDFYATLMPADDMARLSNSEIVKCSYATGNTLAIVRAQRGTSARAFSAGAILANGIYTQDLAQAQAVGNIVFGTTYTSGNSTYVISTNNELLPATPTDGMKIKISAGGTSSGTPKLDLQGLGAAYNIYTGSGINNGSLAHNAAKLESGEPYELTFDETSGAWLCVNLFSGSGSGGLIGTSDIADTSISTGKIANGAVTGVANNATTIGSAKLALATVGTPNLRDSAVTAAKLDASNVNVETMIYDYTVASTSGNTNVDVTTNLTTYKKITIEAAYEPNNTSSQTWASVQALNSSNSGLETTEVGWEYNPNWGQVYRAATELVACAAKTSCPVFIKIDIFCPSTSNAPTYDAIAYGGDDTIGQVWMQKLSGRIKATGSTVAKVRVPLKTPKAGGWVRAYGVKR